MSDEHKAIIIIFCVMAIMIIARLERLGKQIEGTYELIRHDLARTDEERDEILQEWREKKQKRQRLRASSGPSGS